ncbi:MAG TPA: FtsW/RodA/SpoVE family cell cycle protein [Candidatus Marinimicrobia bacterium]|nr:FtsW/RodA/SpoVE family cell cycle protein [Candidatus Neomarinimicrobiota bacterium]HJM84530.1 FtsW/RodA/SpoVE family cell cycle protein [Candidatus Neomarinimicrobiota bacterium]
MNIRSYPNDYLILGTILLLSGFGIVMMYSASSIYAMNEFDDYMHFFLRQTKWLIIGAIVMFVLSQMSYRYLKELAYVLIILSWIILIMGYFFKGNNPASRWLYLGGRSWMTTSDFARVSLIIFTAFFIDKNKRYLKDWKFLFIRFTPILGISLVLILFQPDTSTTMMIAIIIMVMLFIAGADWRYLTGLSIAGVIALILKIMSTPHAMDRFLNWNDKQKIQSINALGTGGMLGSGLGDSIIKNGFLPEAHTDFILPIVGEELGFIGIFILFILFWFLFTKGLTVVREAPDLFSMFLSFGILISVMIYFLVNAAYVVGFAPTTGLPMPFISYGGSHIIFTFISMGILLNIARKGQSVTNSYYRGFSYE